MSSDADITRGLVILWAAANNHDPFQIPWVDHKTGHIGRWLDSNTTQPSDSDLRAAGTDEEAKTAWNNYVDDDVANRKAEQGEFYKVLARLYKELSPLTSNTKIRNDIKKWIAQSKS